MAVSSPSELESLVTVPLVVPDVAPAIIVIVSLKAVKSVSAVAVPVVSKVTTMFSLEVLEAVAVIVNSVAEFSVIVACDVDNVMDGGVLTIEVAVPPPQPAKVENTRETKRSLISFIETTLSIAYVEL